MDSQFVSDLMTQFNDNNIIIPQGMKISNNNSIDINTIHCQNKLLPTSLQTEPGIDANTTVFKNNINTNVTSKLSSQTNTPNTNISNGNINVPNVNTPNTNINIPRTQYMNTQNIQNVRPHPQNIKPEISPTLNQIPKNLNTQKPNVPLKPNIDQSDVNNTITLKNDNNGSISLSTGDFYSIFGFQLSKTTVYIIIGFVIILLIYYIYKYFMSSSDKDKKKRPVEVSYIQQMNDENKEDEKYNES